MIKIKPIIFSASAAFVFSFFTALASKSGLPVSLLKAVIFALVFGALATGIQFVYGQFLSDGGSPSESAEESKPVGGRVDLVVSEEDLPDDKDSPSFFVDGKHVLSSDDIGSAAADRSAGQDAKKEESFTAAEQNQALEAAEKVREKKAAENIEKKAEEISQAAGQKEGAPAEEKAPAFAPVDLAAKASGGESASLQEPRPSIGHGSSGDEEIDELPDIGGFGSSAQSSSEQEGVIEDSEFAQEGSAPPHRQTEFSDGKVVDVKDAPVMAEAIRTILKKEE